MVAKFRIMRLSCRLQLQEVAEAANITPQRLSQLESRYYGSKPQDPERLIKAFEKVLEKQKKEIEKAEYICKNMRDSIFDYVRSSEKL